MRMKKWFIGMCLGLMVSFAQAATQEEQLELAEKDNTQAVKYYQDGKFNNALPLAEKAFKITKTLLGEKNNNTLIIQDNLASIYKALGHFNEALPLYEQGYSLRKEVLGAKHRQTLSSLNNLAGIYDSLARFNEALPLHEQCYSMSKEVLGAKHPDTLTSLNNLAVIYESVGRIEEALPLYEQGYRLSKEVLGAKHPDTLNSLNNLVGIYKAVGRFNQALPLSQQGYSMSKEVLGAKHPDTLTSLNNLAAIYESVGDFKKALPLYEQCYTLRKDILEAKHPDTLSSLNNLALIYKAVGRLNDALPLSEQSYHFSKEVLGIKHPDTVIRLNNLAEIYRSVARLNEALPLHEQCYSINKDVLGAKHPYTMTNLNNLAVIYQAVGRIGEALPLHEQGYSMSKDVLGPKHPKTLGSLNNLAMIYKVIARLSEALALLEQVYSMSKDVLGPKHPQTLNRLNNLAVIYQAVGRIEEALPLYEQGYTLRKEVLGPKHPDTLGSLNNLAAIYYSVGRIEEALPLYEQGYTLRKKVLGPKHPDTLGSLNNLAFIYQAVGRLNEALPLYKQGYNLRKEVLGPKHPDTLDSLNNLGYIYAELRNIDKAIKHFEQSLQGVETLRKTGNLSAKNRQALFQQWIHSYFMLSKLYLINKRPNDAFQIAEMTKARTLLESITIKLAAQQAVLSSIDMQKLQKNQEKISSLNHEIAITSDLINKLSKKIDEVSNNYEKLQFKREQKQWIDNRVNLEMEKNELVKQAAEFHRSLMQKYPRYKQLNDIEIVNAENSASLIPDDALFISYLIHENNQVLVFTLDNTGKLQAYGLGKIPNLDQTLKTYNTLLGEKCTIKELGREGCSDPVWQIADGSFVIGEKPSRKQKPKRVRKLDKISRYLAKQLLEPLKAHIQSKKRWIISPDGALALIPFESLIFENKPVIANYSVSYVQSLSVLSVLKEREKQYQSKNRDTLLAMGAARYELPDKKNINRNLCNKAKRALSYNLDTMLSRSLNDPQSYQRAFRTLDVNWCNLPGAEKELTALQKLFTKKSLFFKDKDASELKLQSLNKNNILTNYRYLLFSAHGYLSTETPALSAIVLDQLNKTPDTDGYITASEWPSYNLKSDLMVLSACETAKGKVVRGEGIIGLPYSLYVAGNKNTLMTLWSVLDDSTADFTVSFFKKLKQGMGQVEALTATKREFLKSEKYKRPLFWAAFVLYGI